jgi:hypothetical protein
MKRRSFLVSMIAVSLGAALSRRVADSNDFVFKTSGTWTKPEVLGRYVTVVYGAGGVGAGGR